MLQSESPPAVQSTHVRVSSKHQANSAWLVVSGSNCVSMQADQVTIIIAFNSTTFRGAVQLAALALQTPSQM